MAWGTRAAATASLRALTSGPVGWVSKWTRLASRSFRSWAQSCGRGITDREGLQGGREFGIDDTPPTGRHGEIEGVRTQKAEPSTVSVHEQADAFLRHCGFEIERKNRTRFFDLDRRKPERFRQQTNL